MQQELAPAISLTRFQSACPPAQSAPATLTFFLFLKAHKAIPTSEPLLPQSHHFLSLECSSPRSWHGWLLLAIQAMCSDSFSL